MDIIQMLHMLLSFTQTREAPLYTLYRVSLALCQGLLFYCAVRVYCANSGLHYSPVRIVVAVALLIEPGCIW